MTRHYSSLEQKLHFMDTHHIDISVLSLANPWLDFLDPADSGGGGPARRVHERRLRGHVRAAPGSALLLRHPAVDGISRDHPAVYHACPWPEALPWRHPRDDGARGEASMTRHCSRSLTALGDAGTIVFLHPHYGLPNDVWGPRCRRGVRPCVAAGPRVPDGNDDRGHANVPGRRVRCCTQAADDPRPQRRDSSFLARADRELHRARRPLGAGR